MAELESDQTHFTAEQTSDGEGTLLMKLVGELDISTASAFRETMEQIVLTRPDRLVFDLSELTFMDSSGIAVLVYAANNAGEVELRHPSNIVRRIIEATGLSEILRIGPS
jgi:anti-sigma B factor antagonist